MYEAGFIGAGNMGGALAQAAAKAVGAENIILTCKTRAHTLAAAERLGCASGSAGEIAKSSRFVFLGVRRSARRLRMQTACWSPCWRA